MSGSRRPHRLRIVVSVALVIVGCWLLLPAAAAVLASAWDHTSGTARVWSALAVGGLGGYLVFLLRTSAQPRRSLLLIIDDLDRCEGPRVVRLLETVHTLLRERNSPRALRRHREPAPFGVLVLANGSWLRAAFTEHYQAFSGKAADQHVHDLGTDFLQKIFDHSVLVPALSPEQTQDLVGHVTFSHGYHAKSTRRLGTHPQRPVPDAAEVKAGDDARGELGKAISGQEAEIHADREQGKPGSADAEHGKEGSSDAEPVGGAAPASTGQPADPAFDQAQRMRQREAAEVRLARDDLGANAQLLVTHLLTRYHEILPGNPRLIIRVTSAWAMLRAVARSLNIDSEDEATSDVLVRAAVMWVRFPVLVDEMLDAESPPVIDPQDPQCGPAWRRRDVQDVLTLDSGERIAATDLAACYGRFFPPPPTVGLPPVAPRAPAASWPHNRALQSRERTHDP